MMARDQLIQLLIIDALEHAGDIRHYRWLERVLENGFCGFANMDELELAAEAGRRGVDVDDELSDFDYVDDDGDPEPLELFDFDVSPKQELDFQ